MSGSIQLTDKLDVSCEKMVCIKMKQNLSLGFPQSRKKNEEIKKKISQRRCFLKKKDKRTMLDAAAGSSDVRDRT